MIDIRDGAGKAEKKPCAPARCELKEKKKERKKERKKEKMTLCLLTEFRRARRKNISLQSVRTS